MPAIIRIGDPVSCGDVMAEGSGNVFANGIPVSRENVDNTAGHCFSPVPVISGSTSTVFTNNSPTDRVGDPIDGDNHCCPGSGCHGGTMVNGSPNVFVDSLGGAGAIIDNNVPYSPSNPPPPEAQPSPPYPITSADIHIKENNDDPDGVLLGPPSGVTVVPMVEEETDEEPAPVEPLPTQDCSTVDALDANFSWTDVSASFAAWAASFSLSPNFTVADLTINTAVSRYPFTSSITQANGMTQKQILQNMCFLAKTVLEPMLALYGPYTVTSAFRNKTGTSQHNKGQAADIQFLGFHGQSNTGELYYNRAQHVRDNVNFDQMILEWFGRNPWIHVSANPSGHRRNVLTQTGSNSYTPGLILLRKN